MINRAKMPRQLYGLGSLVRKLIPKELANLASKAAPFVAPFNPAIAGLMRGIGRFDQRGSLSDAFKQGIGTKILGGILGLISPFLGLGYRAITSAPGVFNKFKSSLVDDKLLNATRKRLAMSKEAEEVKKLGKFKDYTKDGDVRTDDMKTQKIKRDDAVKVYDALMSLKGPIRAKYLQLLQKDKKSFDKAFKTILKVVNKK